MALGKLNHPGTEGNFRPILTVHQKWCILSSMTPLKEVPARFFATDSGDEPVRTWLKKLDPDDRKAIGKDIQKVEFGWPVGLPVCQSLGDGLWEVQSDIPDGRIARVLFGFVAGTMVLLQGFVKKTPKTPRQDRELALNRLKAVNRKQTTTEVVS